MRLTLAHPLRGGGRVSSPFGVDRSDHPHAGVDLAAPLGTIVVSAAAGVVSFAGYSTTGGNMVRVEHAGGLQTSYMHMSRLSVRSGQSVTQGQAVGEVGSTGHSTGNHLHFEVRFNGQAIDPLKALSAGVVVSNTPATVNGLPIVDVTNDEAGLFDFKGDNSPYAIPAFFALLLNIVARRR